MSWAFPKEAAMELFADRLVGDVTALIVLGGILLFVLVVLRVLLKLTATVFRLGCLVILLVLVGAGIWLFALS